MLKKRSWIVLMTACMILSVYGMALGLPIKGSKHDFTATGSGNFSGSQYFAGGQEITEICVFCHTPHSASSAGLLWNRSNPNATDYTLYNSSTLTMITLQKPTGLTLMCMSCHDGITSIAVNSLVNPPYPASGPGDVVNTGMFDKLGDIWVPGMFVSEWGANIGNLDPALANTVADLSNDHPVAFAWVAGVPGIKEPANALLGSWATGTQLKLFNGRMECSTCHNVHDSANPPFLRMSNNNSDMCLACHIK